MKLYDGAARLTFPLLDALFNCCHSQPTLARYNPLNGLVRRKARPILAAWTTQQRYRVRNYTPVTDAIVDIQSDLKGTAEQLFSLASNYPRLLEKRNPIFNLFKSPETLPSELIKSAMAFSQDLGALRTFLALQASYVESAPQDILAQLRELPPEVNLRSLPDSSCRGVYQAYNSHGMIHDIVYNEHEVTETRYMQRIKELYWLNNEQTLHHRRHYLTSRQILVSASREAAAAVREQQQCEAALLAAQARVATAQTNLGEARVSHAEREKAREVLQQRCRKLAWLMDQASTPGLGPHTEVGKTFLPFKPEVAPMVAVLNDHFLQQGGPPAAEDRRLLPGQVEGWADPETDPVLVVRKMRLETAYAEGLSDRYYKQVDGEAVDPLHMYTSKHYVEHANLSVEVLRLTLAGVRI
jgi:hypothetical protein